MIINRKKSSTVNSYISAIKSVLSDIGQEVSEDRVLLSALTRACKLNFDITHHKQPIQKNLMRKLLLTVDECYGAQPYLAILYKAMIVTMYYGLFRIGEVTASPHVVKTKDVYIGVNRNKLKFVLHSSKTHTKADRLQIIKISAEESKCVNPLKQTLCPFKILKKYSQVRKEYKSDEEQFFVYSDGSAVTSHQLRKVFKNLLTKNGFNPKDFTCHGTRSGWAMDLLDMGVSVETIRKIGRWKSNAVYAYLKQ